MSKPTSRTTLIDYALRKLGAPVIKINLDSDQIEDALDDTIQLYQEYNMEAIVDVFRKHEVTQDDIDNEYISLPESLITVARILPFDTSSSQFSTMWQVKFDAIADLYTSHADLKNYAINMGHLALIENLFTVEQNADFARKQGRLYLNGITWATDLKVGDYIVIEGKETIDPGTYPLIYNDIFIKKYFTASLKKQWGANIKKFDGIQMPGGVTLDGRSLYEEATTEMADIEEKMRDEFEEPLAQIYMA